MLVKTEGNQGIAAAKAGMDAKTARKYRRLGRVPGELPAAPRWRTRPDPFAEVWAEIRELLEGNAGLEAKTVFEYLQRRYSGQFADGQVRTLQRRVKSWRATEGPAKEVFFAQQPRSSVKVNLEIPAEFVRLHESIELCLFRVLQESLTNVHRHSGSPAVDVRLNLDAKRVILEVRDYGRGMSPELLQRFKETGMGVGIGLTGMRERISELGGCLEISAVDHGTVVNVSMPLSRWEDAIVHSARPGEAGRSTPAA